MIIFYFPNGIIHQSFRGFGQVTTGTNGTYLIDGNDTTTCAGDVNWKYIAEQVLERNEMGGYLYDALHYPSFSNLEDEYKPLFAEISQAYMSAMILGDETTMTANRIAYQALLEEYNAKLEAIE